MMIASGRLGAAACIHGEKGIRGTVRFYETCRGTLVVAQIQGLPDNGSGFHGFHIHEGSSCAGADFGDTKGHFDPGGLPHPCHAGDLPPLLSMGGKALLAVETDRFTIHDVLGRTVVIHAQPDDFHSQPSGNSGQKIACGKICPV